MKPQTYLTKCHCGTVNEHPWTPTPGMTTDDFLTRLDHWERQKNGLFRHCSECKKITNQKIYKEL